MKSYRVSIKEGTGEKTTWKDIAVMAESLEEVASQYPNAESICRGNDVVVIEDGKKKKPEGGVIADASIY